jgi:ribosomal-protein-alanine N-acetyltransferase
MIKTWFHAFKPSEISPLSFKNSPEMSFRFAGEEDIKDLLSVERDVYEDIPWTASHFKSEIVTNRFSTFIVAESSQIIKGYIGLRWDRKFSNLHISNFIVMKSWQHKGIGTQLFDYALEFAKINGIGKMSLEVGRDNQEAQGFYRKRGFESIQILESYYADGSDAVEMEKVL